MRIRSRIAVVGGIPVAVAVVIAVTAGLLLGRSERVYEAAVLAGSLHRDVLAATAARIDYLQVPVAERPRRATLFDTLSASAGEELRLLADTDTATATDTGSDHRAELERADDVLKRYVELMRQFIAVAAETDGAVAAMNRHAAGLIALTDRARDRQHAANVDLLGSLTEADQRLRDSREVVDGAHELREAMLALQRVEAQHVAGLLPEGGAAAPFAVEPGDFRIGATKLQTTAGRLQRVLRRTDPLADRYPAVETARRYAEAVIVLRDAVAQLRAARQDREAALERLNRLDEEARATGKPDDAARVGHATALVRAMVLTDVLDRRRPETAALAAMVPVLVPSLDALDMAQQRLGAAKRALADAQRVSGESAAAIEALAARILMVKATGYTAVQDEVVQLIAYAIKANDTEQETQNVAVVALRLGRRAADAVATRDADQADRIGADAGRLLETVQALPMAPLLQDEVLAAIRNWRDSLGETAAGLRRLNAMLVEMDRDAGTLIETARDLDETFREEAARIGALLARILIVGATFGLLLAGGAALLVARSISRPVLRLRDQMTRLAQDPLAGRVDGTRRRDEFGEMARAAAFFVREIGLRERAMRDARDRADHALEDLRRTQSELIQAEKMASLGQLVAGVAHEINTPLGNALMGASHLGDRLASLRRLSDSGGLRRPQFEDFLGTAEELARLMLLNLAQAGELVHSFKQVAADQTSGEARRFALKPYLEDLATSLSPSWRRAGHSLRVTGADPGEIDGHPGVLAQVLTNLVMNSIAHGYAEGQTGQLTIAVALAGPAGAGAGGGGEEMVELVYTDDGRGIPPDDLPRVFDPFFTTRRVSGNTGLGLHIVYNLVTNRLAGRVTVESGVGRGVRFTIRFPRRFPTDTVPAGMDGHSPVEH